MKRFVVLVMVAVVSMMVQVNNASAETKGKAEAPSMKQVLLNPKGFDLVFSCQSRSGWSRAYFREDGNKIVADITVVDIKNVDINKSENFELESCTGGAQLISDGIMFNGCSDESHNIFLAYDPGNKKTPFKGSGRDCSSIELHPR